MNHPGWVWWTVRTPLRHDGGRSLTKVDQPTAAPTLVDRTRFDGALAEQVAAQKKVTRHGDRVSASGRRLPTVEVEDGTFADVNGPGRLTELFGDKYQAPINFVRGDLETPHPAQPEKVTAGPNQNGGPGRSRGNKEARHDTHR